MQQPKRSTLQLSSFEHGIIRNVAKDQIPQTGLSDSYGFEVMSNGGMWTEPRYETMQLTDLPDSYWVCGVHNYPLAANTGGIYYLATCRQIAGVWTNEIWKNRRDSLSSGWKNSQSFPAPGPPFYQRPCTFSDLNDAVYAGWFESGLFPDATPDYTAPSTFGAAILHTPSGDPSSFVGITHLIQHHQRLYASELGGADITHLWRSDPADGTTWNDYEFDDPRNYGGANIGALHSESGALVVIYGNGAIAAYGESFENRRYVTLEDRFGTVMPHTVVTRPDGIGSFFLGNENSILYAPQGGGIPIDISQVLYRSRYIGDKNRGAAADALGDYVRFSPVPPSAEEYDLIGYTGPQPEGNTGVTYNWRRGAFTRSAQWRPWSSDYIPPIAGDWSWVLTTYDRSFQRNIRAYSRLDVTDTTAIQYLDINREKQNRHIRSTDTETIFFDTGHMDLGEAVAVKDAMALSIWAEPMYPERVTPGTPSAFRAAVSINEGAWQYLNYNDRQLSSRTSPTTTAFPLDGLPHRGFIPGDFSVRKIAIRLELRPADIVDAYTDPDFGAYLAQGLIWRDYVLDFRVESREF